MFAEQHLHNTQWLYFMEALSLFTSEWEITQGFELNSVVIRGKQRANTDPGFGLATPGRKVIQSFQSVKHLAIVSTKIILFMILKSFMLSQVSLCIIRTTDNWFIQNIPMTKILYPVHITLNPSFPIPPGLRKLSSLFFFLSTHMHYCLPKPNNSLKCESMQSI